MPGFNSKSHSSVFVVKTYVLLITIRPSDGDVKPGDPLVLFDKNRLVANAVTGFLISYS